MLALGLQHNAAREKNTWVNFSMLLDRGDATPSWPCSSPSWPYYSFLEGVPGLLSAAGKSKEGPAPTGERMGIKFCRPEKMQLQRNGVRKKRENNRSEFTRNIHHSIHGIREENHSEAKRAHSVVRDDTWHGLA